MGVSPQHATLVANAVRTFTFNVDFAQVEVLNRDGAAEVWGTFDGTDPVVGADGTFMLPAVIGSVELAPRGWRGSGQSGPTVVKLIASAAVKVSVRGL